MKIISWNVNGIRSVQSKGFAETLARLDADFILLQETKAQADQIDKALDGIDGYRIYSNCAERKGYSGVTILSRQEPLQIIYDIGIAEHDLEGRVIVAEFEHFYLLNVYVPNSGEELARLDYRKTWDVEFLAYCRQLQSLKPNYNKSSGYTQVEIDGFGRFLDAGLVDTFRHFHPDTVAYSWWSFRAGARARNVGWRIDYVLTSNALVDKVKQAFILPDIIGSDHCPVGIEIDL